MSNNGKAIQNKGLFRLETHVTIAIQANLETLWGLLTNAAAFPQWNSTVQSIEGKIAKGETVQLKTTYSPERVFKLKITTFDAPRLMVWEDGAAPMFKGVRRFTLTATKDGMTEFGMTETLSGIMLPMIAPSLPDFIKPFEQYAADLKQAAER